SPMGRVFGASIGRMKQEKRPDSPAALGDSSSCSIINPRPPIPASFPLRTTEGDEEDGPRAHQVAVLIVCKKRGLIPKGCVVGNARCPGGDEHGLAPIFHRFFWASQASARVVHGRPDFLGRPVSELDRGVAGLGGGGGGGQSEPAEHKQSPHLGWTVRRR